MRTLILSNFNPLSQYMNIALSEAEEQQVGNIFYHSGKMYSKEVNFIDLDQQRTELQKAVNELMKTADLIVVIDLAYSCQSHLRPGDVIVQGNSEWCNKLTDSFLGKYDALMEETNLRAFKGNIKDAGDCEIEERVACCDVEQRKVLLREDLPVLDLRIIHQQEITDYSVYNPVLHKLISVLKQVIGGI